MFVQFDRLLMDMFRTDDAQLLCFGAPGPDVSKASSL